MFHLRTTTALLIAPVVASVALAGAPATAAPGSAAVTGVRTAAPAAETGWIRAGHLSPGTPKADIRLTPYAGGRGTTLRGVDYSEITDYARVPTGLYTVAVRPAGADMATQPMISKNVRVTPESASTVLAIGDEGDVSVQVISDDLTPPDPGQAKVRLVSGVGSGTDVSARVEGGPLLAQDVTSGSATGYAGVAAQTWTVDVSASSAEQSVRSRVAVRAGGVYTLLVVDDRDEDGQVRLAAVQDSSGSTAMPTGGVDTGAGGLAEGRPALPAGVSATGWAGALGVLAALLGGVAVLRRATR